MNSPHPIARISRITFAWADRRVQRSWYWSGCQFRRNEWSELVLKGRLAVELVPTSLERIEAGLRIVWSDGVSTEYSAGQLRDSCPCATCREKHKSESEEKSGPIALPVLSLAEARPLMVQSMRPVGNYAYNIGFSDGHDSGIFTFDYLRELAAS